MFLALFCSLIYHQEIVGFHKHEFDEMLCKMDSTVYASSFERNPTLPSSLD